MTDFSKTLESTPTFGGPIALSLSGGGGRAVGFHLGMLSYLQHVDLLKEVSILSTVSGGTFLGAAYSLSLVDKKPFQDFYEEMYDFLGGNLVVGSVMTELSGRDSPPSGRRNLVTAYANVYDKGYFKGKKFGAFWDNTDVHLSEIIFNATEFKTGIAFRFQKSRYKCRIGNGNVWLSENYAKEMRMADVVAASSCIPGGLEPLFFPEDFRWPGDDGGKKMCERVKRSLNEKFGVSSIPLMDGGVFDNQGVSSVMLAISRMKQHDQAEAFYRSRGTSGAGDITMRGRALAGLSPQPHASPAAAPTAQETDEEHEDRLLRRESVFGMKRGHTLQELIHGQTRETGESESVEDVPVHDMLGLFIISDTPVRKDPIYRSRTPSRRGWLKLRHLYAIGWLVLLISLASVLAVGIDFWGEINELRGSSWNLAQKLREVFSFIVPILLTGAVAIGLLWFRARIKKILSAVPELHSMDHNDGTTDGAVTSVKHPWHYIKNLTLNEFQEMVGVRMSSMVAMTNEIFMNRIRDMGYALVHGEPELENKIIANEIFTLLEPTQSRALPTWLTPSRQMRDVVVQEAATMGTKLWWDPIDPERRNELDVLIAAGQITTCYNLLAHIWLRYPRDPREQPTRFPSHGARGLFLNRQIERLFSKAEADWEILREDAYAMVDQLRPNTVEVRASGKLSAVQ